MSQNGHGHQPTTPDEHAQSAQDAYQHGDLTSAFDHITRALAQRPTQPDWRDLLNAIIANADAPMSLVPHDPQLHFAQAAGRALIHAQQGDLHQALLVMAQVIQAADLRYLPWVADWLSDEDALPHLDPRSLTALLAVVLPRVPPDDIPLEVRQSLEAMVPALLALLEAHDDGMFTSMASITLRKLQHYDEALRIAHAEYERWPDKATLIPIASIQRDKGDIDTALATYQLALQYDPDDLSIWLDMGDMLCENGRIREGLTHYKDVLKREPQHRWAMPHFLYYRHRLDDDPVWRARLEQYVEAVPDNRVARSLLDRLDA